MGKYIYPEALAQLHRKPQISTEWLWKSIIIYMEPSGRAFAFSLSEVVEHYLRSSQEPKE